MQEVIQAVGPGLLVVVSVVLYYKNKEIKSLESRVQELKSDNSSYRVIYNLDQEDLKNLKGTVENIKGEHELHEKRWAEIRKNLEHEILAMREAHRATQNESSDLKSVIDQIKKALRSNIGDEQR